MKKLEDINHQTLLNKKVLLRTDFNVPVDKAGCVLDDTRIKDALPSINFLTKHGAKVIICSHIENNEKDIKNSLYPIAQHLSKLIGKEVIFCPNLIKETLKQFIESMTEGSVILIENIRSTPLEKQNCEKFAKELASLADIYVNDAFSVSHRTHASIVGVPKFIPSYCGISMSDTVSKLNKYIDNPKPPIMAIVGGAKISTKLDLLLSLIKKVNVIAIGGAMANTFLLAKGINIGQSVFEKDLLITARNIIADAEKHGCDLILPVDVTLQNAKNSSIYDINDDGIIMDIGNISVQNIINRTNTVNTIWWNGPVGKFEENPFDTSTKILANSLAEMCIKNKKDVIVGGGDTIHAIKKSQLSLSDFTYVSTAGGAFLEFIKNSTLAGIEALN